MGVLIRHRQWACRVSRTYRSEIKRLGAVGVGLGGGNGVGGDREGYQMLLRVASRCVTD